MYYGSLRQSLFELLGVHTARLTLYFFFVLYPFIVYGFGPFQYRATLLSLGLLGIRILSNLNLSLAYQCTAH